jgi:hypothetical protein
VSRRTLTRMAVATAACLVMAVAAASASAAGFVAGKYPASVVGKQTTNITFTSSFGTMSCEMPELSGSLEGPAESLTTSVSATTCSIFGEKAPIAMNGCSFTFHPGSGESLSGTMDIGPSSCGPITITSKIYGVFKIYPKTGMKSVTFTNTETNSIPSVNINLSLSGVKCQIPGGEIKENCGLAGTWNATAVNGLSQVSLQAVAKLPDGVFLTGKGGETGNLPRFGAEAFPVTLTGDQTTQPVFTTAAGSIRCNTTLHGQATAETSEIHLGLQLEGCLIFGYAGSVKTNLCEYVLIVANSGPPYTGTLTLSCAYAGEALEFTIPGVCTQKFPAQTLGTVTYENAGSGSSRKVNVSVSGSAVQYSGSCASGSNGSYKGTWSLEGSH